MKIFLSHRSKEKALIREFMEELPDFLNPWLDEKTLKWGEMFPDKLKQIISFEVDFLIIFFDKDWYESDWVKQELDWAIEREQVLQRTFILPILLPEVDNKSLPNGFCDRLSLNLTDRKQKSIRHLAEDAVEKLFQLFVESHVKDPEDRKNQSFGHDQMAIQRLPEMLKNEAISILLALSKAKFESNAVLTSREELSSLVNIDVDIIDYHTRKLEKDGLIFLASQTGESAITDAGIDYLAENRKPRH